MNIKRVVLPALLTNCSELPFSREMCNTAKTQKTFPQSDDDLFTFEFQRFIALG